MSDSTVINSFLYRMHQDPTILMLDEFAHLSPTAWKNFLASLTDDAVHTPANEKDIYNALIMFNGERFSANYDNGAGSPFRISYVKFKSKTDLTFFMLAWA